MQPHTTKIANSLSVLIIATAALFSCKQDNKSKQEVVETETINSARKYEYADPKGKLLIIQNSLPRGTPYTDPAGKKYFKLIFWTRIINETDSPAKVMFNFPADIYDAPELRNHYKILVPPDTMTVDKEPAFDYGMTDLKPFLDNSINKPSSLKRTINAKESTGFYVVLLTLTAEVIPGTTMRTGLILKGQNLFYRISRYAAKPGLPLISVKEIPCGSINLQNLILKK